MAHESRFCNSSFLVLLCPMWSTLEASSAIHPNLYQMNWRSLFESSGEHGVVIMSLGTLLGSLVPDISEVVASAFARLPQKVIWRHVGEKPSTLGKQYTGSGLAASKRPLRPS